MTKTEPKPNALHYIGIALLFTAYCMIMRLNLVEGFATWFVGCGVGLLGCEYEKHRNPDNGDD